jgi:hypothetical protein
MEQDMRNRAMTDSEIHEAIAKGMREGVQRALAEHKRMGRSIVVQGEDGQIVEIPPEDIEIDPEFLDPPLRMVK